ncbi:hypothetical protein C8F04DRAFT_595624 [Mycena alexandri]|uniref:Uncharacterized protein n=1 Tax=Mycena alexandri TaxID=1745969 RepID=A0AAD6XCD4_9AGAR|nr:hypothetical protein C8F04DRAFT_595624 [Mycena alexandri]
MQPKSLLLAFIAGYFLNSPATTTARLGRPGLRVSLIVSLFAQCVSADAQDFVSPAGDPEDLVQRPHDLHDGGRGRHEDVVAEESVIDMSELKALLGAVVHSVTALQDDLEKTAKTRKQRLSVEGLTFADEMTEDLKRAFEDVVEELKVAFTVVDETRTRAHEEIIGLALDKIGIALLAVCNKYNIKEQSARIHWETIRPPIESMMLLLGVLCFTQIVATIL